MPWTPTEGEKRAAAIVEALHEAYMTCGTGIVYEGWNLWSYRAIAMIAEAIDKALEAKRPAATNGGAVYWDNPNWIQAASEAGILKPGTPDAPPPLRPGYGDDERAQQVVMDNLPPTADPAGYAETSEIAKVIADEAKEDIVEVMKREWDETSAMPERPKRRGRPKGAKNKKAKAKAKLADVLKPIGTPDAGP